MRRVEQLKLVFFTECSVISQISSVLMTQRQVTLKDVRGYLMLENLIHVCGCMCCPCMWDAHVRCDFKADTAPLFALLFVNGLNATFEVL